MERLEGRIPQLDLLRGLAVIMVIGCHYRYVDFLHKTGWAGVDLFFVLSGFLISGLLFSQWKKHGQFSLGRFFIRRGFKIYPSFYVFLLVTLPILACSGRFAGKLLPGFLAECFFTQDYLSHLWGHTWSLAIEEQFYIVLPLLLLLLSKLGRSRPTRGFALIPVIAVIVLCGCLALRIEAHPANPVAIRFPLHLRLDALLVGVALGYWFHFHGDSFRACSRWWLLPTGLTLLLPLAYYGERMPMLPVVLTSNTLGFAALLCWIMPRSGIRFLPLERVGFYSYSIYLWHMPVTLLANTLPRNLPMFCVNLLASCAVGIYVGKAVECRVLQFRDRFFPYEAVTRPVRATRPIQVHGGWAGSNKRIKTHSGGLSFADVERGPESIPLRGGLSE